MSQFLEGLKVKNRDCPDKSGTVGRYDFDERLVHACNLSSSARPTQNKGFPEIVWFFRSFSTTLGKDKTCQTGLIPVLLSGLHISYNCWNIMSPQCCETS